MKTLIKILCLSVLWFSCSTTTQPQSIYYVNCYPSNHNELPDDVVQVSYIIRNYEVQGRKIKVENGNLLTELCQAIGYSEVGVKWNQKIECLQHDRIRNLDGTYMVSNACMETQVDLQYKCK